MVPCCWQAMVGTGPGGVPLALRRHPQSEGGAGRGRPAPQAGCGQRSSGRAVLAPSAGVRVPQTHAQPHTPICRQEHPTARLHV